MHFFDQISTRHSRENYLRSFHYFEDPECIEKPVLYNASTYKKPENVDSDSDDASEIVEYIDLNEKLNFYGFSMVDRMHRMLTCNNYLILKNLRINEFSKNNRIQSFFDGKLAREILSQNCDTLFFMLYIDDMSTYARGSPLAKSINIASILLLNLPEYYISSIDAIRFCLFSPAENSKLSCHQEPYDTLISMVKELENTRLYFENNFFRFKLYCVVADNRELQNMYSIKDGYFGSGKTPCRICLLKTDDFSTTYHEKPELLRTEDWNNIFTQKLKNYSPCKTRYVDLCHDVMLGVIPFGMCVIIHKLIKRIKCIDLYGINKALRKINFKNLNLPPQITKIPSDKKNIRWLSFTASQSYNFLLMFPVIMAYLEEDKLVKNINKGEEIHNQIVDCMAELYLLRKIVKILFSHDIGSDDIKTLDMMIGKHLRFMSTETGRLVYKQHLLTHYPNSIIQLGPLTSVSTLRFESGHQPHKLNSLTGKNRVNEPLSIAKKDAYRECKLYASNYNFEKHGRYVPQRNDNVFLMTSTTECKNLPSRSKKIYKDSDYGKGIRLFHVVDFKNNLIEAIEYDLKFEIEGMLFVKLNILGEKKSFPLSSLVSKKSEFYLELFKNTIFFPNENYYKNYSFPNISSYRNEYMSMKKNFFVE
uniref:ATP-dependent DNA helicase n=1 Tax=Strongyloides papillosus TaxID=174720 RepID=A0A0N5BUT4_STREA